MTKSLLQVFGGDRSRSGGKQKNTKKKRKEKGVKYFEAVKGKSSPEVSVSVAETKLRRRRVHAEFRRLHVNQTCCRCRQTSRRVTPAFICVYWG